MINTSRSTNAAAIVLDDAAILTIGMKYNGEAIQHLLASSFILSRSTLPFQARSPFMRQIR
eukprot:scaffold324_cov326-Pavlova_lutheri.AAC.33